jgi:hypothetical protein
MRHVHIPFVLKHGVALSAVGLTQNRPSLFAQWSRSAWQKRKVVKTNLCVVALRRDPPRLWLGESPRVADRPMLHKVRPSPKTELEISAAKP